MKKYAGIGSRKTPKDVQKRMEGLGRLLGLKGYSLRTGGADGADEAFRRGRNTTAGGLELYLPWKEFNGHSSGFLPSKAAFVVAEKYHPAWGNCSGAARALHARNCHQVLGPLLNDPSAFIICWTEDGKASGGTGQALRIAADYKIKVFNLFDSTITDEEILNYALQDVSYVDGDHGH